MISECSAYEWVQHKGQHAHSLEYDLGRFGSQEIGILIPEIFEACSLLQKTNYNQYEIDKS